MTPNGAPIDPAALRKWKAHVDKSLKDLQARLLPSREKCDELSAELGALFQGVETSAGERDAIRAALLDAQFAKRELLDEMETLEATASLEAQSALAENGKPKYTNDKARAAAVKIALARSDAYKEYRKRLRKTERSEASNRALLESYQDTAKTQRMQARALIARLDNLTAQMN